MVPTTTAPSGAPMDNGATTEMKTMNGKNALFMALVTGMAKEAKRKKMAKTDEREPTNEAPLATEGAANFERDAAPQVNDIPSIPSRTANTGRLIQATAEELEPMVGSESRMPPPPPSSQRIPMPPPAPVGTSRNIHTPSPGRYHKMLSINKLGKEEPQHQIHAKAFREKAYIGPARKTISETPQPVAKEEPKQVVKEAPVPIKCEDNFFAELKHRAALQSVTQSLLAENKETVEAEAIISSNDEVSALGSKSFESEKVSVKIEPDSAQMLSQGPPSQVELPLKPVELPVKYLDVLPDDEKKDIVITNMKEFKAPLPFDEDGKVSCKESGELKAVQIVIETVEQQVDKVEAGNANDVTSVKEEADSQAPIDPPSEDDAITHVLTKSDANTKATVTPVKSNTSHKSLIPKADDNEDDVRSFKSLPATFGAKSYVSLRRNFKEVLEKYGPKSDAMGTVVEIATEDVAVDATSKKSDSPKSTGPKSDTMGAVVEIATEEVAVDAASKKPDSHVDKVEVNDLDHDDATAAISIKEITICSSVKGDRSTALASINSKIEHQTRKLAELEAEALRKHKEAETAATDARHALERMLEAKSKDRAKKIDYSKEEPKAKEVDREDQAKDAPKPSKRDDVEYKSIASGSKAGGSTKMNKAASKQFALTEEDDANFSLCSTWSEDDVRSATKVASKSKGKHDVDCDYQSMASSKIKDKRKTPKEARGELVHKSSFYSDASSSQYSRSFDEISRGSNGTDSNDEDAPETSCNDSTYASSYKEDRKVSEIRMKHGKKSYGTPTTLRSETRGRHRGHTGIATQRSKSESPVEMTRKKAPFLPSLMSPDPPLTKQGKPSRGDFHPRHRSRSQPRIKSSHKMSAKSDVMLSTTKSTNKPNHLLSYSSLRRTTETPQPMRATAVQGGISPETRQPVFARHKSASYEHSTYSARNGSAPAARQPSFGGLGAAPISLAGYTSGNNGTLVQPQMGLPAQTTQQHYKQPYQYTPNSVPSAPISLAGYTRKEEHSFPTQHIPTRPTTGTMGQYSTGSYPAANFSQSAGMQTPQQTSTYAMRPNTTGQMHHVQSTQYQSQQQHVSFPNSANRGRVNQYSMPYEGELL
jgi:hypothetical protein